MILGRETHCSEWQMENVQGGKAVPRRGKNVAEPEGYVKMRENWKMQGKRVWQ